MGLSPVQTFHESPLLMLVNIMDVPPPPQKRGTSVQLRLNLPPLADYIINVCGFNHIVVPSPTAGYAGSYHQMFPDV